tara:strand:+ start:470 stop:757 length:288 start_codon:yes stop_codon:yes gene_type:complete
MVIKEHLDQNGRPDPVAQLKYCSENNCPDCTYCLCSSDMLRFTTPITMPIKEKISQVRVTPTKYDNLSKIATNKGYKRNDHPLWDYIVNKLIDGE